jgi:hypothetical protein
MTDKEYNQMRDSLVDAANLVRQHAMSITDANDSRSQEHWLSVKDSIDDALDKLDGFKATMLQS